MREYKGRIYRGMNSPCKECPDRYEACHDYCEKFQEAHEKWEAYRELTRKNKKKAQEYDSFRINANRKK